CGTVVLLLWEGRKGPDLIKVMDGEEKRREEGRRRR
ncbi:hypothetical protein A2U01_0034772, partial [Trifolium medium]|nr:hypothetical protein [Trifolium medium]